MAVLLDAGHRIRVTVTAADRANFGDGIVPDAPPRIGVHRASPHPSAVVLPFHPEP